MTEQNRVFAIYRTAQQAEQAVDQLLQAEFKGDSVSVLHPNNRSSWDFAQRKHTRVPAGIAEDATAELPLDGTRGIWDPASGPKEGALPKALADMGVPPEWCNRRVVKGEVLLAVECATEKETTRAMTILQSTGAEDLATVGLPESGGDHSANTGGTDIGSRNA